MLQTYYRGEVNVDQRTPEGEDYKRYQYPHIFGSRVNRGDEEIAKSKYPSMLGVIEDDSDVGSRCYSRQSSILSNWEDRIVSGDEEGGSSGRDKALSSQSQAAKDSEFNFHDISKAIPENFRHHNTVSRVGGQDEKVFHFNDNEPGDSPFINGIVSEAKRTEHGSPKVRKHVVQLNTINGHHPSFQSLQKPSSWAVAAGGIKSTDLSVGDKQDTNTSEQNFYFMESSNESNVNNDPNLCDRLNEATDFHNEFENCHNESDEQFKKCTNNGWNKSNKIESISDYGANKNTKQNSAHSENDNVTEDRRNSLSSIDEVKNGDFIERVDNLKEKSEEKDYTNTTNQFSPDKSAELFIKSLISDAEVLTEKTEGPIWILPPDEGTKKKNKKKKKPRA